ncbi:hypothetical protein Tco_0553722 [Tanacetum coccineum]
MRAQEEELAAIKAKRVKMIDEYNYCINFKDDPLPITKFSYKVNNVSNIATMRITRNNQTLNLKIYDKFVLKMLGFTGKLGIPLPPQLTVVELPPSEKKKKEVLRSWKRESKFHLAAAAQLIRIQNAIKIDSVIAREMYDKLVYVIKAREDVVEARKTIQENLDNLG